MLHPERSVLSVPGSRPELFEKALRSEADLVFLDLEDSVAETAKAEARRHVARALQELDWLGRPRAVRINPLDSPHCYRDLVELVESAGNRLNIIILPKVDHPDEVRAVCLLLNQLETAGGIGHRIELEVQLETASGILHAAAIAAASDRLRSLVFGPGDYAASVGMPMTAIGMTDRWDEVYGGSRLHYPMHQLLVAARAYGLRAIDGPYADYRDLDGLRRAALQARALGYDGKWCIHPAQISVVNEVFTPTEDEIAWAKEVLRAYHEAEQQRRGATAIGTTMIDAASLRMAESTLARARAAGLGF
ncbi:L-malyl-CoA/beta-methylmalyl-CoA lyase [bacterium HR28]|nr:L-malyl-CoA/beta-methylmalyl-CoA lyase [bacterium HR28]